MNFFRILTSLLLRNKGKVSVGELVSLLSVHTAPLLLLILSIPSALPIPAVGYSTPFGLALFLIATQSLFRGNRFYVPNFIRKYQIPSSVIRKALSPILLLSGFLEKKFPQQNHHLPQILPTLLVAILSIIMAIPIPLTNTIPAIGIALLAIAMIHNNRTFLRIISIVAGFIITTYGVLFYAAFCLGSTIIRQLFCR